MQKVALVIVRLLLAYLFFTQLWWKAPPTYGCPPDFALTTADASGRLQRTSGLCDWTGVQAVWATRPHPILVSNLDNTGAPEISVDIGFLAQAQRRVHRRLRATEHELVWHGGLLMEASIFVSLFFGLFSRLGALVALALSLQLWIGLAGISNPFEWEWSYNFLPVLSFLMLAFAPGRYFGLDALIRPRLLKGGKVLRALAWLT